MSIESIRNKILPILERQGVEKAGIFGSAVRGKMQETSDIDFLVELAKDKTLFDLISLKLALEKALKKEVDVLTYNSLHPLLKNRILNEQKIIYEKGA